MNTEKVKTWFDEFKSADFKETSLSMNWIYAENIQKFVMFSMFKQVVKAHPTDSEKYLNDIIDVADRIVIVMEK